MTRGLRVLKGTRVRKVFSLAFAASPDTPRRRTVVETNKTRIGIPLPRNEKEEGLFRKDSLGCINIGFFDFNAVNSGLPTLQG
jgi:hypothetical protein